MKRLLLILCLGACNPEVNVGSDVRQEDLGTCEPVTLASAVCPEASWGARRMIDSESTLEAQLVGRWAFCGGEKRYTGRGPLKGFPHGSGIELWRASGQLRYAFLKGGGSSALTRTAEAGATGTVRLVVDSGRGRAVLTADDGQEAAWQTDLFEREPVLQNGAFDVWNFVRVE